MWKYCKIILLLILYNIQPISVIHSFTVSIEASIFSLQPVLYAAAPSNPCESNSLIEYVTLALSNNHFLFSIQLFVPCEELLLLL
mmetsp:Transcript_22157/g.45901  ORF Transcript_22157/g.45901 Transcript_22157/m.45901 type:complete len:85 (-) Transcript_22157:2216-2470(-)